jgi:anti-sigma regulatory factor (Ser/Thr protein kinase)
MLVRLALDLPDDAASVPLCRRVTRTILEELKIVPERRYEIELALGEAATNVVRHAYPHPGHQYHVQVEISDEALRLTVTDEGQGFVRDTVPAPEEEQLGGRGVQLIEQIADVAWFECIKGQGTKLVAEFALPPPAARAPSPAASPPESAPSPRGGSDEPWPK